MSQLQMICASAATRFDGVLDGTVPNPEHLSRGDWIAKALEDASGGPHHIVRIHNRVWTIQHPITERFENHSLFECRYTDLIQIAWGQGAFGEGYHRVWIEAGVLMWEEVA